ncbi:AAA family ATPase [uncultured Corynebacterium sp.]|uniref:AAA family ATPase n=1 Tax=uncultured Corynebacterium sp. TaxID=159447 RepID=UPI00259905B4|nr:ATP-binding protein [uncultured Corynebacterium sp.]
MGDRLFVVGPNASGKSNFIDIFRFLGDIAKQGGGLSYALDSRGGLSNVRHLNSRNYHHGHVEIGVSLKDNDDEWKYTLAIKSEQRGRHRPVVAKEVVERNGEKLLQRPGAEDEQDAELLTQTHLEQIASNREFRKLADYFAAINYFHVSPQAIRQPARGARTDDPYGSGFLTAINQTQEGHRNAWLNKIQESLQAAVPGFESLALETDSAGQPHLVAGFKNWRSNPTKQKETEFSDGTLRLIGLLWAVISNSSRSSMLLLEEPEISLNSAIVRILPSMIARAQRGNSMQVVMTTHSPDLLDDEGVSAEEILVLEVGRDGTSGELLSEIDEIQAQLQGGLATSEILEARIAPVDLRPFISIGG